MKFMLMLYADEKAGAEIPADKMEAVMQVMGAYQQALEKAGAFVATSALMPTTEARTIRMHGGEHRFKEGTFIAEGGELRVHDGPYAETREQLGGYFIIDVASMDEAVDWAKKCPAAQWGPVEVRAFHHFS